MQADKNILLVGGTGYLGSHLQHSLAAAGWKVYISGTKEKQQDNYFVIDFDRKESFAALKGQQFDLVMILASKMNAMGTTSLNHPDLSTNTTGYAAFLDFIAIEKIAGKIIYTSSMTVYGTNNVLPVKEESVLEPVHTYGLSKKIAEQITSFFCRHNNVNGVVLRLPGIYGGSRKSGFVYNVADKCSRNEAVILKSEGLQFWETMHVEDICDAITKFISSYSWNKNFDVFNLAYGEETDFYQTAYTIKQLMNSSSVIKEEGAKGYIPFYLSNEKIKHIISIEKSYIASLQKYVQEFFG